MKIITIIMLCAVSFCGMASGAFAADSLFTSKQLMKLNATGRDIIVPLYLPSGYRVLKIIVDRKHPELPSYAILFAGLENSCFIVEMGTEVGDLIVENDKGNLLKPTSEIHNPVLGVTSFWDTPEYLGTDWFPPYKNTAYLINSDIDHSMLSNDKTARAICKKRMDSYELKKVAESLGVLKR